MKSIKEYLVPTVTLFVICLVAALLLGLTNNVTKDKIAENDAKTKQAAMSAVMPDAASFGEEKEVKGTSYTYSEALDSDGNVIGYAITTIGKGGYSDDIKMMVGVTANGEVARIEDADGEFTSAVYVLSQSETKTVGVKKVINDTENFLAQFIGVMDKAAVGSPRADGGGIDVVSGATKTSNGMIDGVNNALQSYKIITGGES